MKTKLSLITLAALLFIGLPLASSSAYVAVSVGFAPPAIPVYEQPLCPGPGYIWTPGYWAYGPYGYYWVPGVWVVAPGAGLYWTPGYWAFSGGNYLFHDGYWGPTIGFYGGINYGYGYWGHGYYGGRWVGNTFNYNTTVTRVNKTVVHNTYADRAVLKNKTTSRTSFNGQGGVQAKPTTKEQAAEKTKRTGPTNTQRSRTEAAQNDPSLRAKENKGKPKADAVSAFSRKNAPESTGGANGQTKVGGTQPTNIDRGQETSKQASAGQTGSDRQKGKTTQAAQNGRPTNGNRDRNTEQSSERGTERTSHQTAAETNRKSKPAKATTAHRTTQAQPHSAVTTRRPQTVQKRPPAPSAHAPVEKQSSAKKKEQKKKKNNNGGGD
jgi:hypothetical protein